MGTLSAAVAWLRCLQLTDALQGGRVYGIKASFVITSGKGLSEPRLGTVAYNTLKVLARVVLSMRITSGTIAKAYILAPAAPLTCLIPWFKRPAVDCAGNRRKYSCDHTLLRSPVSFVQQQESENAYGCRAWSASRRDSLLTSGCRLSQSIERSAAFCLSCFTGGCRRAAPRSAELSGSATDVYSACWVECNHETLGMTAGCQATHLGL